jgi:hypothetical protein
MRFHELVKNCKWEDIQPVLLAICRDRGPYEYVTQCDEGKKEYDCFEEAFNNLKSTEPVESDVIIRICEWEDSDDETSGNRKYIDVYCIEKDYEGRCGFCYPWDESLGMEIVLENGLILSPEETVANCLWEMTFWGFSWEEIINHLHVGGN